MSADSLYHRLFSHPLLVEQLVRGFLPEAMAEGVDFTGMAPVSAKFHDAVRGVRREGDVIWRLPLSGGGAIYLYLLLEFQSRIDRWMALRTQIYQALLWQDLVVRQGLDRLPPVLTVVLYNGAPSWTAPQHLSDLIDLPSASPLWAWQPQARYHLLDMGRMPPAALAGQDSLASLLFRLEQRQDPPELLAAIDAVIDWFRQHPSYDDLKRLFASLVGQAMTQAGVTTELPTDLQEMKTMLATLGQEWQRQWLEEGRAEGRVEGHAEGRVQGRAEGERRGLAKLLCRQLERRFGPLPKIAQQRIETASLEQLEAWGDLVLEAEHLEAVLGALPQ